MRLPLITCLFTAFATTALAAPVQWSTVSGGNDHYYELITAPLDWVSARSDATSRQHAGFQGYLTSITSQAEQNFVLNVIAGQPAVWTGGADLFNEGTWTWHDGPEHGTIFHQNGVNIGYNAFIGSEPNGGTGENALETGFFGSFWNDRPETQPWGYVVEYGGIAASSQVPIPAAGLLLFGAFGWLGLQKRRQSS